MNLLTTYLTRPATQRILRKKPGQEGFSLIELVVVIAVLAVLTAIALPNFLGVSDDASARAAQQAAITAFKECQVQKARGNTSATANFEPTVMTDFTVSAIPAASLVTTALAALPLAADRDKCFVVSATGSAMNNFLVLPNNAGKFASFMVSAEGIKNCVTGGPISTYGKTYNVGCDSATVDTVVVSWK
jgi:prepilin-type N-terminal cleavage/methylation domain-containing protein